MKSTAEIREETAALVEIKMRADTVSNALELRLGRNREERARQWEQIAAIAEKRSLELRSALATPRRPRKPKATVEPSGQLPGVAA